MTSLKPADVVNPFTQSTLIAGRNGATLEKSLDPQHGELYVRGADQLHGVEVYEGRGGESDVVVTGGESRPKNTGFKAQLAHYAKHGGTLEINGKSYKAREFDGRTLVAESSKSKAMASFDLTNGVEVAFGAVEPAFSSVETPSAVKVFFLDNVEGKDELTVRAQLAASANVDYSVTVTDASDQDAIQAELKGFVTVTNGTEEPIEDVALTLRSNEAPEPRRHGGFARAALETMQVADSSESAGGVIDLPVRAGGIDVKPGQTRTIGFTAALNGTPNDDVAFIPVTLKQTLSARVAAYPELADRAAQTTSPRASYEMQGTEEAQPAGSYVVSSGSERWGALDTHQFTPEKTALDIGGTSFPQIKLQVTTKVNDRQVIDDGAATVPALPTANRVARQPERVKYSLQQTIEASSKSEHDRKINVDVDPGLEGVKQVMVTLITGGREISQVVDVDPETGTAPVELAVPAGETVEAYVNLTGTRQE